MVVSRAPTVTDYCATVRSRPSRQLLMMWCVVVAAIVVASDTIALAAAQVDEGDTEIVNIRETDERLGPLVFTLVGLGCVALVATCTFWWLTRPKRMQTELEPQPVMQGDD